MQIVDFDHDLLEGKTDAKKAGISLISEKFLPTTYAMNPNADGGFPTSELYNNVLSKTVFNAIPNKLRSKIKTIYKWYNTGDTNGIGDWFGTKIWLPLVVELDSSNQSGFPIENNKNGNKNYAYFSNADRRKKEQTNFSEYWTSSRFLRGGLWTSVYCDTGNLTTKNSEVSNGMGVLVCFSL